MSEHASLFHTLVRPSRLSGRLRAGVAASMALLIAGVGSAWAASVETAKVAPPVTIELTLDSALPVYDIAWSDHAKAACQALADQAIAEMDDPATPFILRLSQIPVVWKPLPASFSSSSSAGAVKSSTSRRSSRRRTARPVSLPSVADMNGAPIDRQLINRGRITYERDLEIALLDIVALIRDQRPGALLTIDRFVSPQVFGASADAYLELQSSLDFVVLEMPKAIPVPTRGVSARNRRSRARALAVSTAVDFQSAFQMAGAPEGMWVAVGNDGEWTAVDDDPLPDEITEEPDENTNQWNEDASSTTDVDASDHANNNNGPTPKPPVLHDSDNNSNDGSTTSDDGDDDPVDQTFGSDDTSDDNNTTNGGGGIHVPTSDDDDSASDDDSGSTDDSADDSADDSTDDAQTTDGGGTTDTTSPGAGPILVPGVGFTSVTPLPAPYGAGPGSNAQAIARWDVVPFQTFSGQFTVGVVAFHVNGIERVEFSANGGQWIPVYRMELNPRTNVWEYFATLDASDFADGLVEVRAVVYPTAGVPRVLGGVITNNDATSLGEYSMFLNANSSGSLPSIERWVDAVAGSDDTGDGSLQNPFKTLWTASQSIYAAGGANPGDGAVIHCNKGVYEWFRPSGTQTASTSNRWLTVQPASGVLGSDVFIVKAQGASGQGLNTKLVRLKNITLTGPPLSLTASVNKERFLWIDNSTLRDGGLFWTLGWYDGLYVTDTLATNMTQHAILGADLARNDIIDNFGGDGFKAGRLVVNCELRNQVGAENSLHSDIWQEAVGYKDNVILYGLVAKVGMKEQGVFSRTDLHRDLAIINCEFRMEGYPAQSQWRTRSEHMLVRYNTFLGEPFQIALSDKRPDVVSGYVGSTDAQWKYNIFQWLALTDTEAVSGSTTPEYSDLGPGVVLDSNHFMNIWPDYTAKAGQSIGKPIGSNATEGPSAPAGVGAYGKSTPPWIQ